MKKLFLLICTGLMLGSVAAQGSTVKVEKDDYSQLQVHYELGDMKMQPIVLDGRSFIQLVVDGAMPSSEVGAPSLPTFSHLIEVPLCRGFKVEVSGEVFDTLEVQGTVVPLQPSRSKSDLGRHALVINEKIYSGRRYYGAETARVGETGIARDRRLARLEFSPVRYNPVDGRVIVCRSATVTVHYEGAQEAETRAMFERYHSPAFSTGTTTLNSLYKAVSTAAPVRYLIVAHSSFRGQMDTFVQWKRRKGFITDIVYTGDAAVGTTSTSIAAYVKSQYTGATASNPAPTYLLLVGDHEQIPAFDARVSSPSSDHITDLYYASWTTGDILPDCYYGRFSAQNVAQLTPQIEKTLMYEQYGFADPSFLDRAVMVAGVDGGSSGDFGYTHADPAMDYAITNYVNGAHGFSQVMYFKNNTSIVPTGSNVTVGSSASSNSATVRNYYNQGAGWINYSAHGSATSWGTPSFTTTNAENMTNTQKFGIMIGNCCLTNKFETTTCLGEAVLRKGNYCGAVGYIGGSNSTYWDEDFYWAVGVRSNIGATMSMAYNSSNLGGYDRIFHTHNETYSNWVTTQGELMFKGNMAVQSSTSSYKNYYWEIYHLMGDPSLMPYLTQAPAMTLTVSSVVMAGSSTLAVTAVPYAYIALTDTLTRTLVASAFADANGNATLALPSAMAVGAYEVAASAQQYQTGFASVNVVPAAGAYPVVVGVEPVSPLVAGSTVGLRIKVANIGNQNATGVSLSLSMNNPLVTLSSASVSVGTIAAGDTVTITSVSATSSAQATDGTQAVLTSTTHLSGSTTSTTATATLTVNAPTVTISVDSPAANMLPGSSMTLTVTIANSGHAPLGSSQLTVTSSGLTVQNASYSIASLAAGATVTRQVQLNAAANIDSNIFVPVYIRLTSGSRQVADTLRIYIGENSTETFEGGHYQVQGWVQGSYPWSLTNQESYEGSWSARSTAELGNSNTSEMSISFTSSHADSVSFYYKVSSEENYDKFHCYLDGVEKVVASGEVGWTRAAFAVTAGNHQLQFTYAKDVSIDRNSDCAWVDYICLPHGSQSSGSGGGGDDDEPEQGTFQNLIATFESPNDDSRWTISNGSLCNRWYIGTAAANNSSRGMYISNDNGQSNDYTVNCSTSVFVYTTLWLDNGDYTAAFDWRCNGESNYDYLRAALLPASITPVSTAEQASGWTTTSLPSGAIAIDGGQKLNQSTSWQTKVTEVQITQSGWYRLAFYWRNDYSIGHTPPAAVDNVMLIRAGGIRSLTVNATHGTTTGSGNYQTGEVATIGVYPEAGYTFLRWNDGNTDNPRQLVVDNDITLTATLSRSDIVTVHDTVYSVVHDSVVITEYIEVPVHDTTYIDVPYPVHDTIIMTITDTIYSVEYDSVLLTDTVTLTEYVEVPVHDTTYIDVPYPVHDTTTVTIIDTVTLTEYVEVPVHDTTYIDVPYPVYDTIYSVDYDSVVLTDTVTLTEYIEVPVYDTTYIDVPYPVYDTIYSVDYDSVVLIDTVTLTEYIEVPVYDTTYIDVPYPVYDTINVTIIDTVTLTEYVEVPVHDTTYIDVPYPVHDTTIVTITDTVINTVDNYVYDTIYSVEYDSVVLTDTVTLTEYIEVPVHDTTYIDVPYPVHDTTTVTIIDTVTLTEYVEVPVHDTTYIDVPYPVHDTTIVTITDTVVNTVDNYIYDTIYSVEYDSVVFTDTTIITDTLWLTQYDTIWLNDTIIIHDTIYITQEGVDGVDALNVKVYSSRGHIVVEGMEQAAVEVFDAVGRRLEMISRFEGNVARFPVPASGVYLVKVGDLPARRVVVVR